MQDSALSLVLPLILIGFVIGGGLYYIFGNTRAGGGFGGSLILSGFATLVFALFFVGGLFLLFSDAPSGEILPGLQMWTVRVFGCGLALFGMFGLLIARGLAVLISIEHAAHTAVTADGRPDPRGGPSAAYRVGQVIGKAIHGGERRGQHRGEA